MVRGPDFGKTNTKPQNRSDVTVSEAGATFDNSFFDNYFDFLRQFKNGSFLVPVFVHATGRRQN